MCVLFWDERPVGGSPRFTVNGIIEVFNAQYEARNIHCSYTVLLRNTSTHDEPLHVVHDSPCPLVLDRLDSGDEDFTLLASLYGFEFDRDGIRVAFSKLPGGYRLNAAVFLPYQLVGSVELKPEAETDSAPFRSYMIGSIPPGRDYLLRVSVEVNGPFYEGMLRQGRFRIYSANDLTKVIGARAAFTADGSAWQELLVNRIVPSQLEPSCYHIVIFQHDPMRTESLKNGIVRDPAIPEALRGKCERWCADSADFELDVRYAATLKPEQATTSLAMSGRHCCPC